jgi:hypothetical protein
LIPWNLLGAALALWLLLLFYRCRSTSAQRSRAFPTRWDLHAPVARKRRARRALQRRLRGGPGDAVVIQRPGFVRDVCFLLAILLTSTATVWAAMSFLSLYAACVLLIWTSHCCPAATVGITETISPSVAGAVWVAVAACHPRDHDATVSTSHTGTCVVVDTQELVDMEGADDARTDPTATAPRGRRGAWTPRSWHYAPWRSLPELEFQFCSKFTKV